MPSQIGKMSTNKKEIVPKIPKVERVSKKFEAEFENLWFQKMVSFKNWGFCFEKTKEKVAGPVPKIGLSLIEAKAISKLVFWEREISKGRLRGRIWKGKERKIKEIKIKKTGKKSSLGEIFVWRGNTETKKREPKKRIKKESLKFKRERKTKERKNRIKKKNLIGFLEFKKER